jgi:hypothetical protein
LIGSGLGWRVRLAPPANISSVGVIVGIVVGENDGVLLGLDNGTFEGDEVGVLLGQDDGRRW